MRSIRVSALEFTTDPFPVEAIGVVPAECSPAESRMRCPTHIPTGKRSFADHGRHNGPHPLDACGIAYETGHYTMLKRSRAFASRYRYTFAAPHGAPSALRARKGQQA